MTTAHRPTWAPAQGGEEQGGNRAFTNSRLVSALNLPSHTQLKFRQQGQNNKEDIQKQDIRGQLEEKEREHFRKTLQKDFEVEKQRDLELLTIADKPYNEESQQNMNSRQYNETSRALVPNMEDADVEDDVDQQSESEDEEDEEAELLAELERIKKEREQENATKAQEEREAKRKEQEELILRSNPLMNQDAGDEPNFRIKRRWDEDVVFKNQAKGEPKLQKRFINDTVRNDFHKRFLMRYIK